MTRTRIGLVLTINAALAASACAQVQRTGPYRVRVGIGGPVFTVSSLAIPIPGGWGYQYPILNKSAGVVNFQLFIDEEPGHAGVHHETDTSAPGAKLYRDVQPGGAGIVGVDAPVDNHWYLFDKPHAAGPGIPIAAGKGQGMSFNDAHGPAKENWGVRDPGRAGWFRAVGVGSPLLVPDSDEGGGNGPLGPGEDIVSFNVEADSDTPITVSDLWGDGYGMSFDEGQEIDIFAHGGAMTLTSPTNDPEFWEVLPGDELPSLLIAQFSTDLIWSNSDGSFIIGSGATATVPAGRTNLLVRVPEGQAFDGAYTVAILGGTLVPAPATWPVLLSMLACRRRARPRLTD